MAGMKVVVRISCAVALLVQCATCDMYHQHVKAVMKMLWSKRDRARGSEPLDLPAQINAVAGNLYMLQQYNAFELNKINVMVEQESNGSYNSLLHDTPVYCPTTTMLACGQADVPVDFCLELLRRANVLVKTFKQRTSWMSTDESDSNPISDKEPSSRNTTRRVTATQETGWQPSTMPNTKPVASSRKRSAASIEREELIAEVQELLEKRPSAEEQVDILVEERRTVLEIKIKDWESMESKANEKLEKLKKEAEELKKEAEKLKKEAEELKRKQERLEKQQASLKWDEESVAWSQQWELNVLTKLAEEKKEFGKERDSLQEQGDARMKLLQNEAQSRNTQIKRSVQTMRMLAHFPYKFEGNLEDEKSSKKWINEMCKETKNLRDVAKECYPEQFIVCGRHARSVADDKKRADAVSQCIDTIRKYNGFRRMARATVTHDLSELSRQLGFL